MDTITVMLVDDHQVVAEGLESLLSTFADIEVVASHRTVAAALAAYGREPCDVVLMDVSMPEVDGIQGARKLLELDPDAKVIALTGFATENLVTDVIDAGAAGYMLKSVGGPELTAAIRSVASGRAAFSQEAVELLVSRDRRPRVGHDLTPRELDVLDGIVNGRSNKQIGHDLGVSAGTVRVHVSNILAKLGVANRTAAATVAQQHHITRADPSSAGATVHRIDPRRW